VHANGKGTTSWYINSEEGVPVPPPSFPAMIDIIGAYCVRRCSVVLRFVVIASFSLTMRDCVLGLGTPVWCAESWHCVASQMSAVMARMEQGSQVQAVTLRCATIPQCSPSRVRNVHPCGASHKKTTSLTPPGAAHCLIRQRGGVNSAACPTRARCVNHPDPRPSRDR